MLYRPTTSQNIVFQTYLLGTLDRVGAEQRHLKVDYVAEYIDAAAVGLASWLDVNGYNRARRQLDWLMTASYHSISTQLNADPILREAAGAAQSAVSRNLATPERGD